MDRKSRERGNAGGVGAVPRVCILALSLRLPPESLITYLEAAALSVTNVAIFMPTHMERGRKFVL